MLIVLSSFALADEVQFVATVSSSYTFNPVTGARGVSSISHGVGVLAPGESVAWYGEVGFSTPYSELVPSGYVLGGPNWAAGERWRVGVSGLYKVVPSRDQYSHVLGGAVVPILPSEERVISFPFGIGWVAGTDTWSLSVSAKVSVPLR